MIRIRPTRGKSFVLWWMATGAVLGSPAFAANEGFMADSPVTRFTSEQKQQQQDMLGDLLANANGGERRSWQSSDGRVGGEGGVRRTFERNGQLCKDLSVRTWFRTMKATNDYRLCKGGDGQWYPAN